MHNVLIISYIAFSIGNLFILPESCCIPQQSEKYLFKKIVFPLKSRDFVME